MISPVFGGFYFTNSKIVGHSDGLCVLSIGKTIDTCMYVCVRVRVSDVTEKKWKFIVQCLTPTPLQGQTVELYRLRTEGAITGSNEEDLDLGHWTVVKQIYIKWTYLTFIELLIVERNIVLNTQDLLDIVI